MIDKDAELMIKRYSTDNEEHSHFGLIDIRDGYIVWEEEELKIDKSEVIFPEIITQREWDFFKERMKDLCKSRKSCKGLKTVCIFYNFCSEILNETPENWD